MAERRDKVIFGSFCLDRAQGRVVRMDDQHPVALTPKAFNLLDYLAARPGQLVKKGDLLSALWADTFVGDSSIKVAIREIRKALADDADAPQYIETVHRRGYRFIATVSAPTAPPPPLAASRTVTRPAANTDPSPTLLVGREREMQKILHHFTHLCGSFQRECIFLTGSPGRGKTALIEAFVRHISASSAEVQAPLVLIGHCFEQFGV